MYLSRVRYPVSGQTAFSVPFMYLSRDHVRCYVDGVEVALEWMTAHTVTVPGIPNGAEEVLIKRMTPKDELLVNFTDGSILKGIHLKTENLQLLFIAQEAMDDALDGIRLTNAGIYVANSKRITDAGDPEEPGDLVTLRYADAKYGGNVVNRAEEARDLAIQEADRATQQRSEAQAALAAAEEIRDDFAEALSSTFDRFACFATDGADLVVTFTDHSDNVEVKADDYRDVFILSGSASLSISPQGDLLITL